MDATDLIIQLCQEAGDDTSDLQACVDAFLGNHDPELIAKAASGDVAALAALRDNCGLPILR